MTTKRYKWAHPSDWIEDRLQRLAADNNVAGLFEMAQALAGRLDGDSLQDLFQVEMADDGYFNALTKRQ